MTCGALEYAQEHDGTGMVTFFRAFILVSRGANPPLIDWPRSHTSVALASSVLPQAS